MPKKSNTFVALFHTQWTSAKATVPPQALKRCEFNKGLGPLLDTLEKKWDAAADQDPVPAKVLADLKAQVDKFQKVTKDYRTKVIQANTADPGNGPGWFALHEALHKIDKGVVEDMRELGVNCAYIKGWADKATFDRTAGKIGPGDGAPADSSEYRKRGFKALEAKIANAANDPVAFSKALDNGLRTCLPHSRDLVKKLGGFTGAFVTTTQNYKRHVSAQPPDAKQAKADVAQAKQIVTALGAAMPAEGQVITARTVAMTAKMEKALPK